MCIPIIRLGKSFVDAIIEVLVMRENDMSADIIELPYSVSNRVLKGDQGRTNPSGVTSVEASPPGVSLESTRSQEASF